MRSTRLARIVVASVLLFAIGNVLSAQDIESASRPKHRRYKFIDLGTLGGPDSIIPFIQRVLTSQGTVIGIAETDIPDPFAPLCASPNCKVQNGFEWRKGVMTQLPGLSAFGASAAQAINDSGTVVGDSEDGLIDSVSGLPEINAVLWRNGEIEDLGTLGGNSSGAISVNEGGQVTGWSETNIVDSSGETETHAFLWKNGSMHDLGTLGGPVSFGQDVNDRGEVVGFSFTDSTTVHPFFWESGQMTDLSLGGTQGGSGLVNSRGDAIGDSTLPGDVEDHAFLWSQGKLYDLGTLGGTKSLPTGLTEDGHVSGMSRTTNDETRHAVLWRNKKISDLGTVPGDACSFAWGLNSKDQVVGISLPAPCDFSVAHAFLWEKGSMVDLNTLIPQDAGLQLVYAEAINDAGEIVGIGVPPGVSPGDVEALGHAYVLIPEEDTFDSGSEGESVQTTSESVGNAAVPANADKFEDRMVRRTREQQLRKLRLSKQ
jgi:probable HAF family extracellular repeat protein